MTDTGCILALDVGGRRIGVAVSDPLCVLARPLTVIRRTSKAQDFAAIARFMDECQAGLVVCGHPLSLDGGEGPQGRLVRRFAEALQAALAESHPTQVKLWDERYSTSEAYVVLESNRKRRTSRERSGGKPKGQRDWVDAVAAAVILQSYLDAHAPAGDGVPKAA